MYKFFVLLTLVLLASTLICGFWLRYSGQKVDESALNFHASIALASVASVVVTFVLRK
jgi:hypothetical protein